MFRRFDRNIKYSFFKLIDLNFKFKNAITGNDKLSIEPLLLFIVFLWGLIEPWVKDAKGLISIFTKMNQKSIKKGGTSEITT